MDFIITSGTLYVNEIIGVRAPRERPGLPGARRITRWVKCPSWLNSKWRLNLLVIILVYVDMGIGMAVYRRVADRGIRVAFVCKAKSLMLWRECGEPLLPYVN